MADSMDSLVSRRVKKRTAQDDYRDYQATKFARGAAKKFSKGRFTATQTGAKELAQKRNFLDYVLDESDKKPIKKGIAGGY